jgi:predicted transcriptional regulator of viral defense system
MKEVLTDLDRLREIAVDQYGFVTARQGEDVGVSVPSLSMMTKRGRLVRIARGLFRVPQVPATRFDPFMKALLWVGFPEACLSHDSALDAWEISDINPDQIHMTIGARRRMTRAIPDGYVIHRQDLASNQVTWWEGIPTVTPSMAIRQCLESGVPTYLIRQAIERSTRTGTVPASEREQLIQLMESRYV